MNKAQKEHVLSQLDRMYEELDSVDNAATRAELRGKYIELFIDMCTMPNLSVDVHENIIEETAQDMESEVVVEEIVEEAKTENGVNNVVNGSDIFEDAEEVRTVVDEDGAEIDITEIYNVLKTDLQDVETIDGIGLFLTQHESTDQYINRFNYMAQGLPRAYAAYLGTHMEENDLVASIVEFSGLPAESVQNSTDFITDENAEELFDFICQ